jgi:energy-coupling factor transporter transmembrane protein EcfT
MPFHPVVRLLVWGATAVMAQFAVGLPLAFLLLGLIGLSATLSLQRFARLLRRTRWLLLALGVMFAWGTPGVVAVPDFADFSPSREGLVLAATHVGRLVAVLASLSLLLKYTPAEDLVSALHRIMSPLERLGIDRCRIAVRLLLVIEYVESGSPRGWRDWLIPDAGGHARTRIALKCDSFARRDRVAIVAALICATVFAFAT